LPQPIKPDALHALTGTKSQAKVGFVPEGGRPKFPAGIREKSGSEAKRAFKRLSRMLAARRAVTPGDQEILRLYAFLYDRHQRALSMLEKEGEIKTYYRLDNHGEQVPSERPNYWLKIAETCESKMQSILRDLGLTPSARKNVHPTGQPNPVDELDAAMGAKPAAVVEPDINLDDLDEDVVLQ